MGRRPVLAVEHCEPVLSAWLLLEYRHCAKIWGDDLVFTRITKKKTERSLQELGRVEKRKASEVFAGRRGIVLDPQAQGPLTPKDCKTHEVLVIGGLLGYEMPHGRTKTLISDASGFETRHLGDIQLSIDGAAFVTKAISLGMKLSEIEIAREVEITQDRVHSTILPFGYPIIDDHPIITPGLIAYLRSI